MSDTIYRQDAIDAIAEMGFRKTSTIKAILCRLETLPSAQTNLQPTCNQLATDCISRQAAIAEFSCCELTPDGGIDANYAIDFLEQLPSAQRTGRWIIVTDSRGRHAECPYCGEWKYHSNQKFCGECGAQMEGEEE